MRSADAFGSLHPAVGFLYFGLVVAFSMILMHPVCLAVSLGCAFAYAVRLKGGRAVRFALLYLLPLMLATALLNPAFSHAGATTLTYLPDGNPLTLESVVYGLAAAAMFASVMCWFGCYTESMTSDKFVYLFGRVSPALSLVVSMTLRAVPRFRAQLRAVSNARKCMGPNVGNGIPARVKNALAVFSVLVTWALEDAVDTAESMKSRGYGLPGRTAFSVYRFGGRDRAALLWLLLCGGYIALGARLGGVSWRYFPTIRGTAAGAFPASVFLCHLALCITPLAIDIWEDRKWNALRSAI